MPVGDILPEIALLLTAVSVLLVAMFTPHDRQWLGAPLSLLGLGGATLLCLQQIDIVRITFSGVWAIDGASVWARVMILGAAAFTVLLAPTWFRGDRRHGEYYAILLMSTLGAMALAAATNLLQLMLAVLLSSVTGYTLAAYHRDWPLSLEAGMKYFLLGAFANVLLAIGVTFMFGLLGTSDFKEMAIVLEGGADSPLLVVGIGLVVVGLSFKLAAVPVHSWMADVSEGAPAPAAAFLSVVPKIGAAVALIRLTDMFPADEQAIRWLIAAIATATMTVGNLGALWQDDVRRLIGWSSVSQSGYALMAVAVVGTSSRAVPSLLVFLLGYMVANLAAFAVITHLRGRTDREDYIGLAAARPWMALILTLSFLSLVGIPPLAGFLGKLALFIATIDGGYTWLGVVAIINTVASLFYYLRIIGPMYFDDGVGEVASLGRATAVAAAAGAVAVVAFGVVGEATYGVFDGARLLP